MAAQVLILFVCCRQLCFWSQAEAGAAGLRAPAASHCLISSARSGVPPGCRLELALLGGCDVECEDQLQHLLTVHLRTRYLANDMNPAEVSGHLHNYEGSEDHKPAVYLHSRFNDLLSRYSAARPNRR